MPYSRFKRSLNIRHSVLPLSADDIPDPTALTSASGDPLPARLLWVCSSFPSVFVKKLRSLLTGDGGDHVASRLPSPPTPLDGSAGSSAGAITHRFQLEKSAPIRPVPARLKTRSTRFADYATGGLRAALSVGHGHQPLIRDSLLGERFRFQSSEHG